MTADAHEPLGPDEDPVGDDLGTAELIESSGVQDAVAVAGPGALVMVPVAWLLTRLRRLVRRT